MHQKQSYKVKFSRDVAFTIEQMVTMKDVNGLCRLGTALYFLLCSSMSFTCSHKCLNEQKQKKRTASEGQGGSLTGVLRELVCVHRQEKSQGTFLPWDCHCTTSKCAMAVADPCQKIVQSPLNFNFCLKPWRPPHDYKCWLTATCRFAEELAFSSYATVALTDRCMRTGTALLKRIRGTDAFSVL